MANIKKLQEAMDLLLNEEDDAADAALHEYFVGLARKINEEFQDAELEEAEMDFGDDDNVVDDMAEIDQEEGVIEDDDFSFDDETGEDEFGGLEGGDETMEVPEDKMADLRDAFDALSAEFAALGGEEEGFGGDEEGFGDDMDMDMDDEGEIGDIDDDGELGYDDGGDDEEENDNPFESVDLEEEDDLEESEDDTLREYTEKVPAPANVEGKEVGTGPTGAVEKGQLLKPKGNLKGGNAKPHPSTGGEAKGYAAPKRGKVGSIKGTADNKVAGKAKSSQKKVPKVANTEGGEIGSGGKNRGVDKKQLLKQRGKN